jgi:hypothetical protein
MTAPYGDEDLLTTVEAAKVLRQSKSGMETWRYNGEGPPWMKMGRKVVYPYKGIREFIAQKLAEAQIARKIA